MNTPISTSIDSATSTTETNFDSKLNSSVNTITEVFTIVTMWGLVATFVTILGLSWV